MTRQSYRATSILSASLTPSNFVTDGKWRRIKVSAPQPPGFPRLVVRSRKRYYALSRARRGRGSEAAPSSP